MSLKFNKNYYLLTLFSGFLPIIAYAQFSLGSVGQVFGNIITYIIGILRLLEPILFIGAFVVFFWGLSKLILSSGNQVEATKGKNYMLWGILALFILISFLSIVNILSNEFFNYDPGSTGFPFLPMG